MAAAAENVWGGPYSYKNLKLDAKDLLEDRRGQWVHGSGGHVIFKLLYSEWAANNPKIRMW